MRVSSAVITFNSIFGWLFNPVGNNISNHRSTPNLAVNLIERGAIKRLEDYCHKHKIPLKIVNTMKNEISIEVIV